jgi:hypothetical protein
MSLKQLWHYLHKHYIIRIEIDEVLVAFDVLCGCCTQSVCTHIKRRIYHRGHSVNCTPIKLSKVANLRMLVEMDSSLQNAEYDVERVFAKLTILLSNCASKKYTVKSHRRARTMYARNYHLLWAYCANVACSNFAKYGQTFCDDCDFKIKQIGVCENDEAYEVSSVSTTHSGFVEHDRTLCEGIDHGTDFTHFRQYERPQKSFVYNGGMELVKLEEDTSKEWASFSCAICTDDFKQELEVVRNELCWCLYHKFCIDTAIRKGQDECPSCDPDFCCGCLHCSY